MSIQLSSKQDIEKYTLADFNKPIRILHLSAGTTGQPTLCARGDEHLKIGRHLHEKIIKNSFAIHEDDKTLVVICFSFNGWIASNYTLLAFHELTQRDQYNFTLYPPGPNIDRILPYLEQFYAYYKHIIFVGAPKFILRLIKSLPSLPIASNIYTITSGEKTSLAWKKKVGYILKQDPLPHHHINIYGCADAGPIAYETELSIQLMQIASESAVFQDYLLTGLVHNRPYSIMQYDPNFIQLTTANHELFITAKDHTMPLNNYRVGDIGHIINQKEIQDFLQSLHLLSPSLSRLFAGNSLPFLIFLGRDILYLGYRSCISVYVDFIETVVQQVNEKLEIFTENFIYYIDDEEPSVEALVIELEVRKLGVKISKKMINNFLTVMAESNADIKSAIENANFLLRLRLIKPDQLGKRKMQLEQNKVDAIYQETGSKPKFINF